MKNYAAADSSVGRTGKVLMAVSVASMIDQFNMPNIRLLQQLGYEVHVACNFIEGSTCDKKRIRRLRTILAKMHVRQHQWDCPRDVLPVRRCWKALWQLWELTGRYRFDWMHCQSPVGGALARLAAHGRGIRAVYTAHGFHFYKGAPLRNWLFYYPVEKLLARWTDVLVTVNKEDYRFAKRYLQTSRIYHIPGIGIDIGRFQKSVPVAENLRDKYKIPKDAVLLLSVGELSRRKNHQAVLRALAGIQRPDIQRPDMQRPDIYYLICGTGSMEKKLHRQAQKDGIASRVRLVGYQEEVTGLYLCADIFVFPSIQEGMPVALMEAMAAGLPCVVSDIRGSRELVTDTSLRFPLGHPEQLPAVLLRLAQDSSLRQSCGRQNQKKIEGYSLQVAWKRMRRIYMDMEGG